MRQQKQKHDCPECGGPLKKTIGARTRKKFWECANNGPDCYRQKVGVEDAQKA